MYDDVFKGRERDKVVCSEERGQEGVTEVGFELDAEGGEDEDRFFWVLRKVWVNKWMERREGGTYHEELE